MDIDDVLFSLLEDHKYMVKMTYLFDQELQSLTGLRKQEVNKERILDLLQYLKAFSAIAHHKLEDFLFEKLMHYPLTDDEKNSLEKVMHEHEYLDEMSCSLETQVCDYIVSQGDMSGILLLASKSKALQFSHLEQEQKIIFPLLEQYLSPEEWHESVVLSESLAIDAQEQDMWRLLWMRENLSKTHAVTSC